MVHTRHHHLDIRSVDNDVAHLFEHLIINGFFSYIEKEGYHPAFIGWVTGETFDNILFINAGFYDSKVASLFDTYLEHTPSYTDEQIHHAMASIEAELQMTSTISDNDPVKEQLHKLGQHSWDIYDHNTKEVLDKSDKISFKTKQSKRAYKKTTIAIHSDTLSIEEQKVLLRLYVIMDDFINHILRTQYVSYALGTSPVLKDQTVPSIGFISSYILPKEIDIVQLQEVITQALHDIDITQYWEAIQQHFTVFAKEPLWLAYPRDYYRHTGIVTTNKEIAQLATKERIRDIFSKLTIQVRPYRKQDQEYI